MEYELHHDRYQLIREGAPVGPALTEVALLLDLDTGSVLKHGDPVHVRAWHETAHQAFLKATDQMPQDLARVAHQAIQTMVLIQGKIPLEDLNKCLAISGYAGLWYARQGQHLQTTPQGATLN